MLSVRIRDATPGDAAAACLVLRRSITELCVADHRNDPAILGRWLANKTPEVVAGWAVEHESSLLIAVEGEAISAVGAVKDFGEITLNCVAPEARFRGVSSMLLAALEARAAERVSTRCTLLSTETAHRFYLARGYADDGSPQGKFGTNSSYPCSGKSGAAKRRPEKISRGGPAPSARASARPWRGRCPTPSRSPCCSFP